MQRQFIDQWMPECIPDSPLNQELLDLKKTFFEQMSGHGFSMQRLYWLHRWLGESNCDQIERRLMFLLTIWNKSYFHPFSTVDVAANMILSTNSSETYVISLSSTVPGMIRVSYFRNGGVVHVRITLETFVKDGITEVIDYNVNNLEDAIHKYLQRAKKIDAVKFIEYVSKDVFIKMEDYDSQIVK